MSIFIKGMPMPRTYPGQLPQKIEILFGTDRKVYGRSDVMRVDENGRLIFDEAHEIIPLPSCHGRIGDIDELLKRIEDSGNYISPAVKEFFETAETIIEAEG